MKNSQKIILIIPVVFVVILYVSSEHVQLGSFAMSTTDNTSSLTDTIAPVLIVPHDISAEATGLQTVLSFIGNATANDNYDSKPVITNNSTDSFQLGATTILWTATDASGNTTTDTQIITIQDTTPPVVTPPADVTVNATAVLTAILDIGSVSVTDLVDSAPTITNDAPDLFPIGNTTITWNVTDSSGNWYVDTQLVTVLGDNLDSDWHYVLQWTDDGWGHAAIAPTKYFDDINLFSSDVGYGNIHLFKTFRTTDIQDHNITIRSVLSNSHNVMIHVLDGEYSKSDLLNFNVAQIDSFLKGGGILASYSLPNLPASFNPDWERSKLDYATLVISMEKNIPGATFQINSVEFANYSKWVFDDYKVEQRYNKGTYILLPVDTTVNTLPVNDTFDNSLDGWKYWGYTPDYILRQDRTEGSPSPSVFLNMDQFTMFAGISKIVNISNVSKEYNLTISYDYRAKSNSAHSTVTNSLLYVLDADTGNVLVRIFPVRGGVYDTQWQSYSIDITDETVESERIEIILGFFDSWIANWNQMNWYDNVVITAQNKTDF